MKYSVYGGSGFVGGNFSKLFPNEIIKISREERKPELPTMNRKKNYKKNYQKNI